MISQDTSAYGVDLRSGPNDPAVLLRNGPAAGSLEAPYVLMTGAADYQSALDGPIDEGRHYGLFTLSMGRVMGQAAGRGKLAHGGLEWSRQIGRKPQPRSSRH